MPDNEPNSSSEEENVPQEELSEPGSCLSDDEELNDDVGETTLGKRGRKENGLVTLTLRFIALLKKAPNQTLDLNVAVEQLEV